MPSNNKYIPIPGSNDTGDSPPDDERNSSLLQEQEGSCSHGNIGDTTNASQNDNHELPSDLPPAYEPSSFHEFDIDESEVADAENTTTSFRTKAGIFANSFNRRVVQPINKALDPVYQLYCYANARFEYYIGKVGNPLIVKRMLYIFFFAVVLYLASLSGLNPDGVVGSRSDFMDPQKLLEFIELSVDPQRLEENLEYLSSMPHLSGTSGDLALARYFQDLILKSRLEMNPDVLFETYTNYPLDPKVQLLHDNELLVDCDLKEKLDDGVENDYYKLAFNPGSRDMTSKGKLIYANYGTLADYELLKSRGIDVKGCILLMKYGGIYAANKKLQYAQERGASGVLFISDPEMDMYYDLESIQREPVAFTEKFPGNILASGRSSGSNMDHNGDMDEKLLRSGVMPAIPSIPIKWKDFITIMDHLSNQGSRIEEWDIQINDKRISVWSGKSDEILLQNSLTQRPYKESWNLLGKLQGIEQDTFSIIIGASRDTMCYGATESSGSAVLLELMNIFSEMSSSLMWRPLRSIYFASFTGSKYNLAGATNFAVKNSEFMKRDVYAYIDLDDIIQGNDLEISSDPLFASLIKQSLNEMMKSNTSIPEVQLNNLKDIKYDLGPASNSFVMQEHFGVGSISLKLTERKDVHANENEYERFVNPKYPKNSCLDTFANFRKSLLDPDMSKHSFMTKLVASIAVKLADIPILPHNIHDMIDNFRHNVEEVIQYSKLNDGNLQLQRLEEMTRRFMFISEQNEAFVSTWNDICDNGRGSEPNLLSVNRWDWNAKILLMTKVMISVDGTYKNPWNGNVFYGIEKEPELRHPTSNDKSVSPKQALPGVWDALDKQDWNGAQQQIDLITDMMVRCMDLFQY